MSTKIPPHSVHRCISLIDTVSFDMLAKFVDHHNDLIRSDNSPISVIISTEGGDMYAALAIYDLIQTSPVEIVTYGLGSVMSAGCLILSAGHKRYLYPNTFIMDHEGSFELPEGRPGDLKSHYEHTLQLHEVFDKALSKSTKKAVEDITSDFKNKTVFMTAKQAVDYGLADGIVGQDE